MTVFLPFVLVFDFVRVGSKSARAGFLKGDFFGELNE
jgi:hypothetical protein